MYPLTALCESETFFFELSDLNGFRDEIHKISCEIHWISSEIH